MAKDDTLTKKDAEEIVGRVVGEVVGDALGVIALRFDDVDKRFEQVDKRFDEVEVRLSRIEGKLDPTIELVDRHSVEIEKLKQRLA